VDHAASASYISVAMAAAVGQQLDRRRSFPISSSDIRRWALAIYHPEMPPERFLTAESSPVGGASLAAPEDFNPFAWLVADPLGPPVALAEPEDVLGIPGPGLRRRIRGGMEASYGEPMRSGDVITAVRRLAGYDEREGRLGRMLLTTIEETWTNQRSDLVKRYRFTFIRY
jgi:N-terminal half of MaoC dehydratase